jgi:UDP-N-acetylglucosamine 2-epimerase (non-hydrolysing)
MAVGIAAFYSGAKVCHVEAGLRTFDRKYPFPEEFNRQLTGKIADYHFAPTILSQKNLLQENINNNNIIVTGNTVIDALLFGIEKVNSTNFKDIEIEDLKEVLDFDKKILLVTGHRRENHGDGFVRICEALKEISISEPEKLIIYPVHLNPKVQKPVNNILSGLKNVLLINPLSYKDFVWLMNRAKIIITDSGGIQEEAPSLGKPVLVMRDTTERPEAVDSGTAVLVGTNKDLIISEVLDLLNNESRYKKMGQLHNPYGKGKACKLIVDFIKEL